jgi:hypothetical protein
MNRIHRLLLPLLLLLLALPLLLAAPFAAPADMQGVTPGVTPGLITPTVFVPTPTFAVPVYVITPATGCAAPLSLTIGMNIVVRGGINIRYEPSMSAALLNYFPQPTVVTVIDGPRCANGYNWWRISGYGQPGWVIEGRPGRYFIEPFGLPTVTPTPSLTPSGCVYPLSFQIGSHGAVRYRDNVPRRLRTEPNTNAPVIVELLDGIAFEIIGGPVCAETYNWWQVRILTTGITGWIAEGRPGRYFVEVISH